MRSLRVVKGATPLPEVPTTLRAQLPIAILSLHSHRDRSFLDDVTLHHLSGTLRANELTNDLVVAYLPPRLNDDDGAAMRDLVRTLQPFHTIVYERVWTAEIIQQLRLALPHATFIRLRGEHAMDDAPADVVSQPEPDAVVALLHQLLGHAPRACITPEYTPNVQPLYASEQSRPTFLSFPILGNTGCPYRADARENPLFANTSMPNDMGRGCAFCTTGNHYEYKPHDSALAWALTQLRFLRREAPEVLHLVLRDQNPFYYLTELIEHAEREKLGPFTLLMESRADWFLQNEARFVRALESASRSSITLAPFLVGVENFSQNELNRFNKGIRAETNHQFLHALRRWKNAFPTAMDLSHAAFGFILFTPWTTIEDLRINLQAIRETKMHEFRGHMLLSRARLYSNTALYYLAQRDGLLADAYASEADNTASRYGYLPAQPFRFQDPAVAQIADVSAQWIARQQGRGDESALLQALLELVAQRSPPYDISLTDIDNQLARSLHLDHNTRVLVAKHLVNADALPVSLPAFGLTLLDVQPQPPQHKIVLVIGTERPLARVALRYPPGSQTVDVTLELVESEVTEQQTQALRTMQERLRRGITRTRWNNAQSALSASST